MKNDMQQKPNTETIFPLVSVVMPVYNAAAFVEEAIRSLIDQNYPNLEIVVVDDCSTDNSWEIICRLAKENSKLRIARNNKNRGIASTVNRAIRMSKGDFLGRLDADDVAMPYRISQQVSYLRNNEGVVAVGGQCYVINAKSELIGFKNFPLSFEQVYRYIYMYVPVQQSTLLIDRKRLPKKAVYYREDMVIAEEIELFFQMFQYGKVENLPDYLVRYRLHQNNNSFYKVKRIFYLTLLCRIRAVLKYNYTPEFAGVLVTLLQLLIVLVMPEKVIVFLYRILRDLRRSSTKEITITTGEATVAAGA